MKDYSAYIGFAFSITVLTLSIHSIIVWMRAKATWRSLEESIK